VLTAVFALSELITWSPKSALPWVIGMVTNVGLAATAAVLAFLSARHFGRAEASRTVWLLIALLAAADCGVLVTFTLPKVSPNIHGLVPLTLATSLLTTFSRGIALPIALWMMVKVYRQSSLLVRLKASDYAAMAIAAVLGIGALAMVSNVAKSQLFVQDPILLNALRWIGVLLLPAMVVTSIFGVTIWRYAKQMGGGLVATAWISILLCTVLWLARFAMLGALNLLAGMQANARPTSIEMLSFWMVAGSEYLLMSAASYQYEVCTTSFDINQSDLSALAAQFENNPA